ncbi:hypothetical protein [Petropleomorpha daqingensis]|uniref:Septum formation-related domain-containing protein n=1 Tax=Petropleomorpha daqingensis TaxID=2026353 RepID=A0A853CC22_9ACTN|nr:hypothetical protein [Petropleomorpha daqingensis]NYJ05555.1 hypothetical protein [Petropleomorpha daqingensis]
MRGTILGGAVLGIVVLTAAPALACSSLTPRACAAAGGTFAHQRSVSTCTVTTTARQTTAPFSTLNTRSEAGLTAEYDGQAQDVYDVATTTTRSQRGRGPITTTTSTTTTLVGRQWLSCHVTETFEGVVSSAGTVDPDVCAHPENYPLTGLIV